ncbi:MAG TPA: TetR/AcrR family transcriptional regulator [Beutenbergiaceae bacterium]|nr:TetR/AcrR family transcriptional regulator [Beutenbergiaceae bacterium]
MVTLEAEPTTGRRTLLLEAAHDVVAHVGFHRATVKAIAARAGVATGSVYTYFASRQELLAQVFTRAASIELAAVEHAVENAQHGSADRIATQVQALVDTFARRAFANRTLAWALLSEPAGELIAEQRLAFRRRYAVVMESIIATGVDTGAIAHQDPRVVAPGLIGLISESLAGPLSPHRTVAVDHLISEVQRMCLRAIGASS